MTTRFPNGITTAAKGATLGEYILPDVTKAHTYFEDFDYYTAADWTVTEVGVATQALADEDGGVLLITNAALDNDSSFQQKVGESFKFESGKKVFFEARFKLSDVDASSAVMGLQITDTTPLDVTDGVFFIVDDTEADGTVSFVVEKNNTATTTADVATLTDATHVRLGFAYNGVDSIAIFVDGAQVGSSVTTNLPDDEELTVSFGVQNGAAAAKTMSVDYIFVAKER